MPRQLIAGENLVLPPLQKHWIVLARGVVVPLVIAVALLVASGLVATRWSMESVGFSVVLVALSVTGLWATWTWLVWRAASLTVTDQRVIFEEGLLIRTSKVIPLDRVQDVSTRQNIVGRVLGYGDLEVDTAGSIANDVFTYLPSPELLRDQVFVLSEGLRRGL
jgi:uncharacterized membrane protein YdbT with pleckstrin-like domain